MKRTQLLVLSVLALGLNGVAQADTPYPSDAEASYSLPALSTYADQFSTNQWAGAEIPFPSDAEAVQAMPVRTAQVTRKEARLNLALASGYNFSTGGIDD